MEPLPDFDNFVIAVQNLALPPPAKRAAKGAFSQAKSPQVSSRQLAKVVLNGYAHKHFSREVFRELIGGVKELGKVGYVELTHNGLNDSYVTEIEALLTFKRCRRFNLSFNDLGRQVGCKVAELLRSNEGTHLEWLSLVGNVFSSDATTILAFTNALRALKLYHFGLTIQGSPSEQFCRALGAVTLSSLSLSHSSLTDVAVQNLVTALVAKKKLTSITALDLSSCYLSPRSVLRIAEAIKLNRTLVKLNLSSNGLNNQTGRYIAEALAFNMTLHILNLQFNELGDNFCKDLSTALRKNVVLTHCDISSNAFSNVGAQALSAVIGTVNKTCTYLGDLTKNSSLSVKTREDLKGRTLMQDYELLAPLEETNPDGDIEVLPWNLNDKVLS